MLVFFKAPGVYSSSSSSLGRIRSAATTEEGSTRGRTCWNSSRSTPPKKHRVQEVSCSCLSEACGSGDKRTLHVQLLASQEVEESQNTPPSIEILSGADAEEGVHVINRRKEFDRTESLTAVRMNHGFLVPVRTGKLM
jgi:hypothetical protein